MKTKAGKPEGTAAAADDSLRRSVFAAERACDVLKVVCAEIGQPKGVKDISVELGLSMSSVHRLLAALVRKELVRQDPESRKYLAGPWLLDLALTYLRQLDLPQIALPHMNRLRDQTRETVTLSMREGASRIYLLQVESPQEIRQTVETGRKLPLHLGGSGKAILAFLQEDEREAYLAQPDLAPAVDGPIDVGSLREQLAAVRRRGFAHSRAERLPGAASVAAPIRDLRGKVVGCLSIGGPVWRFTEDNVERFGELIMATAEQVSRGLGAPGQQSPLPQFRKKAA